MKSNQSTQHAIFIPKLSAKNSDSEPWRIQRLKRIVGQLNSFSHGRYKQALLEKLVSLHDENNTLQITWASEPSTTERRFTNEAWSEEAQHTSGKIHHIS